jgi:sensor histidine kinase YesM
MAVKHKLTSFFWAFFSLGILLQLSFSKEFPFSSALILTACLVLTLWAYIQCISTKAAQHFMARLNAFQLAAVMIGLCVLLSLLLMAESYAIIKLTMNEAAGAEVMSSYSSIFFGFFIVAGFISGSHYLLEKYKESLTKEKELETLKRKSLEMEISLLRNQLSPHFTFNILNNLQFLIRKDQNRALHLLSTYSRILRYYIYESQKELIALDAEVSFLKEYFDLETNRHVTQLEISSHWDIPDNNYQITPFILATFVENAFKHVLPNQANEYFIRQTCFVTEQGHLAFEITNTFAQNVRAERPRGVGLKHVRERLNLAYPSQHRLQLQESDELFSISLELSLKK